MYKYRKINKHPIFIAGRDAIDRQITDDNKCAAENLVRKWLFFCQWAFIKRDLTEIKKITRDVVILYGQHLKSRFDAGDWASTSTPAGYIYAVNKVMSFVTSGSWESVRPVRDCNFIRHSYIPNKTPTLTAAGIPDANSLASYLLELQRTLGLPFSEACRLDLRAALRDGRKTGFITTCNTGSGKRRLVPCRSVAITAIGLGIAAKRHQKKMLPEPMSYNELLTAHKQIAAKSGFSTDSGRSVYVQERYLEITGVQPPIKSEWKNTQHIQKIAESLAIPEAKAKRVDKNARITIVRELGVLGVEKLSAYLDKPNKKEDAWK